MLSRHGITLCGYACAVGFTACILLVLIRKNYFDVKTTRNRVLTTNFDIRALIYRGYFAIFCEDSVFF